VLTGNLTDDQFRFHASAIFATGGMILSGDDLTTITPARLAMLRKLQPPSATAARFADVSLRVGVVDLPGRKAICLFNWTEASQHTEYSLSRSTHVRDFWTDEDLGRLAAGRHALTLAPHSGRVLMCTPAS
jgi:alpha-galactosidase